MPMFPGFIGPAYKARSTNFDAQRCVNLYLEKSESGSSINSAMLIGTPGLRLYQTLTGQSVRGMIVFNDTSAFVVVGRFVHRLDLNGIVTATLGTIENGTTPVSMASNGQVIFFVTGNKGYSIDPSTNILSEFVDVSFTGANRVGFIKGSFVFNQPGTSNFWAMDPYSLTLNPLYFGNAEGSPDGLVSLIVDHQELWLFGTSTTEVWIYNGDTTNFPFSPISGAFIEMGCIATHSVAKADNSVFWLSADEQGQGTVMRADGYRPVRVSDHAMEKDIASYATVTDAIAYTYQQEGHEFYVLSFPTADKTWVLDISTRTWHERLWRKANGTYGRHRSNCHMYFARKNIVGDWESGKIYEMDLDEYTDDGNTLARIRTSPYPMQQEMRVAHHSLTVMLQTGVGLVPPAQGSDPEIMMRFSDDGGHTWSNERRKKIGKIGKYKTRARFTRLGSSTNASSRCYEVSITDPVKVCITGAIINE